MTRAGSGETVKTKKRKPRRMLVRQASIFRDNYARCRSRAFGFADEAQTPGYTSSSRLREDERQIGTSRALLVSFLFLRVSALGAMKFQLSRACKFATNVVMRPSTKRM